MLNTNGIPPKLAGRECQELICQQYYQNGKLVQEVDVLCVKANEKWYELYFENSTVFWRPQNEGPTPNDIKDGDPFTYPLIDLGNKYNIKGQIILDYESASLADGVKVSFLFEKGDKIVARCVENQTRLQHLKL